ncbi:MULTISPECIES: lamin tail domain-containing protein [unclassified Luteococcus]|uniref:lamin tail domain-containing protein n=1 Tax=unclassified Luteococcus TaxID=2639923 RepID=UPI00313F1C35
MRRRALSPLLIAGLALAPLTVAATPADAASSVRFTTWVADPAGKDAPNNAGWNREYITVKNTSRQKVVLTGWVVRDSKNKHSFTFPKGFTLKPGAQVILHSGQGRNSATHLYFNLGVKGTTSRGHVGYVWNNSGDTAQLLKGRSVLASCTYKPSKAGKRTC